MINVKGDLLYVVRGIICHQVNTRGVMGAGLALGLKRQWPQVYDDYLKAYQSNHLSLGSVVFTNIVQNNPNLQVVSMCAQEKYGRDKVCYTDYGAFRECLKKIKIWHTAIADGTLPIYFPKGIGCGLAGGDWNVVKPLIEMKFPNAIIMEKV